MAELSDINEIGRVCGRPRRTIRGGVLFSCPCHKDRNPSCMAWYGDSAILIRCFAGCDRFDVIDCLRSMGFVLSLHEKNARESRDLSKVIQARRQTIDRDAALRTSLARKLWSEGLRATGSRVERYLALRGLSLDVVRDVDHTIRFHPACPRGRARQGAMIAALRDVATDELVAIHRTYLDSDDHKDGVMVLGPSHEAAIKLSAHHRVFDSRSHFAPLLHACEGLESGVGSLMLGYAPVWSLGSAGAIERFEPMLSVGELWILADNDFEVGTHNGYRWRPGQKAAEACVRAWYGAGWRARWTQPEIEGSDYADLARHRFGLRTHHK